jgi:hypothetical protein
MKNILSRIQRLGQKAVQVKLAVQAAPGKAAEMRQAVLMTAGQFQQIGAEMKASLTGLQTNNDEERLIASLREVDAGAGTFAEAGYLLRGVDMELGPAQRLVVRLEKVAESSASAIRLLAASHQTQKTVHALLLAILKAEELAGKVDLGDLVYRELSVFAGPAPIVRICWRPEEAIEIEEDVQPATAAIPAPAPTTIAPEYGQDSFFQRRTAPPPDASPERKPESVITPRAMPPVSTATDPAPAHGASPNLPPPVASDWRRGALDRFKQMPDLSKPAKRSTAPAP